MRHLLAQQCRASAPVAAAFGRKARGILIILDAKRLRLTWTETGGPAWRQTIFFPFAQMSRFGRGKVLRAQVESETYDSSYYDPRGTLELTDASTALRTTAGWLVMMVSAMPAPRL